MRLKHLNVIGRFKSGLKVFCRTYVIVTGRILRFQDVHIIKLQIMINPFPFMACRAVALVGPLSEPDFAQRASSRQPSL